MVCYKSPDTPGFICSSLPIDPMPRAKPITKDDLLQRIKMLRQDCDKEAMHRMDIERSPDYRAAQQDIEDTERTIRDLQTEITATRARQTEMLSVVSDSRPALEEAKRALMQIMEAEGVEGYVEDWISVSGKWSERRSVDGKKLLTVLGGDIDTFVSIVKPTQKSVKQYADEVGEPALKKQLMSCIKLESRELVDVDIQLPDAE